jgi:hypothetical protein
VWTIKGLVWSVDTSEVIRWVFIGAVVLGGVLGLVARRREIARTGNPPRVFNSRLLTLLLVGLAAGAVVAVLLAVLLTVNGP